MQPAWAARFHERYIPEPNSGCFLWLGRPHGPGKDGYGKFRVAGRGQIKAHRLSYELRHGIQPGAFQVCHSCDTPACVNPDHLFLGTNAENAADKKRKGRGRTESRPGESHPLARLNETDVLEIRRRRESGERLKTIAHIFGVSIPHVCDIVNRKTWGHI